jgi:hypothetical protein
VEPPEECDDGNTGGGDGCAADCTREVCGNGRVEPPEECEPNGMSCQDPSYRCTDSCICVPPSCGNGTIDQGEECDPGGKLCENARDSCTDRCTCVRCGDGTIDQGEECDPGGKLCEDARDRCTDDCTCVRCGDGTLDPGEECDPNGVPCAVSLGTCTNACTCVLPTNLLLITKTGSAGPCNGFCPTTPPLAPPICLRDLRCGTRQRCGPALTGPFAGRAENAAGDNIGNLVRGCLYIGTSANEATPANATPDGGVTYFDIDPATNYQEAVTIRGSAGAGGAPHAPDRDTCSLGPLAGQPFRCFFGPPLPIVAGAFSTCVINNFRDGVAGTVNTSTGEANVTIPLAPAPYLIGNPGSPCPKCVNHVCSAGKNAGQACNPVGSLLTTHDCPPSREPVGVLQVTLTPLTTGEVSMSADPQSGIFCQSVGAQNAGFFGDIKVRKIVVQGVPAGNIRDGQPHDITLAAAFCIPSAGSIIDAQVGTPGPGATAIFGAASLQ